MKKSKSKKRRVGLRPVKFVMRKAPAIMLPTFAVVELKTSTDIAWFYDVETAKRFVEYLNGQD